MKFLTVKLEKDNKLKEEKYLVRTDKEEDLLVMYLDEDNEVIYNIEYDNDMIYKKLKEIHKEGPKDLHFQIGQLIGQYNLISIETIRK